MEVSWDIFEVDPSWAMWWGSWLKFPDGTQLDDLDWPVVRKWNGKELGA